MLVKHRFTAQRGKPGTNNIDCLCWVYPAHLEDPAKSAIQARLVRHSLARHDTAMSTGINPLFSFRLDSRVDRSVMDRLLADVAQAGFHAVEWPVTSKGLLTPVTSESDCRALAERSRGAGLSIAVVHLDGSTAGFETALVPADLSARRVAFELVCAALDRAAWLGADTLVIAPAVVGPPNDSTPRLSYDEAHTRSLEALLELRFEAARRAVRIACHAAANRFLLSPLEMREFVDACNSPWVGASLDTGDVMTCGGHPGDWIRILTHRLAQVVISEGSGDCHWPDVAAALRQIDFRGPIACGVDYVDPSDSIRRLRRVWGE